MNNDLNPTAVQKLTAQIGEALALIGSQGRRS